MKIIRSRILQKETYWQFQLMTLEPHGINLNNRKYDYEGGGRVEPVLTLLFFTKPNCNPNPNPNAKG